VGGFVQEVTADSIYTPLA